MTRIRCLPLLATSEDADVLVIEDIRTFRFPAVYARTLAEAWVLLISRPWREIWLDHDMGRTANDNNTYALAVFMEQRAQEGDPLHVERVYVHTANPSGGDRLMAALSPWYDVTRVSASDYLLPGSEHNEWIGPR